MTKALKFLAILLLIVACIFVLCACGGSGGGSSGEGGSGEGSGEQGGSGEGSSGEGGSDCGGEEIPEVNPGETLYYSKSEIVFISSSDNDSKIITDSLMTEIGKSIAKSGHLFAGNAFTKDEDYPYQIIVGSVPEKAVSVEAYRILGTLERESEISELRYVIYADSGKIAIAYEQNKITSYQPIYDAVARFVKEHIRGKNQMFFEKGIIMSGTIDLITEQRKLDDADNAVRWESVKQKLGDDDTYLSLRNMFETIFNHEIVSLIASYYDPATGLFYASRSGKNTEGIYPIPEATTRVLEYISNTGMLRNTGMNVFGNLQKYKLIYQIKSIQDESGEFYVAQMPMAQVNSNRIGRDRGACLAILNWFKAKPTYDVGTYSGDGVTGEQYWADLVARGFVTEEDKPLIYWADKSRGEATQSLATSVATAVSKVSASGIAAAASATEPFESHENFIKWLLDRDPYNNPYTAMSATDSATSLIRDWNGKNGEYTGEDKIISFKNKEFELKHGDTLYTILIRWLNSNINSAGLFGKVTNGTDANGNPVYDGFFGGWGYQNSNGFLKAIGRYANAGVAYPEPMKAAESLLKGINSDESVENNILVVYNVWSSLNHLRNNVQNYYPRVEAENSPLTEAELAAKQEILDYIDRSLKGTTDMITGETLEKSYAAVAIDKCLDKIMQFKKSDGGFSHRIHGGTDSWQGGLPVGLVEDNMSDMDAINVSTAKLAEVICQFYGLNMTNEVPIYTQADLLTFLEVMSMQEYVIKEGPKQTESSGTGNDNGDNQKEVIDFESVSLDEVKKMISSESSTADIVEKGGNGKVLYINKVIGGVTGIVDLMAEVSDANTVSLSFDILLENVTAATPIEIYLRDKDNNRLYLIYLTADSTDPDATYYAQDRARGIRVQTNAKTGEWNKITVKFYEEKNAWLLYVNEKYVMMGDTRWDENGVAKPTAENMGRSTIYFGMNGVADIYIDNVSLAKVVEEADDSLFVKPGESEDSGDGENSGANDGANVPDDSYVPEKNGIDFENGVIPESISGENGNTTHTIVDAGNGNKALRIVKPEPVWARAGLSVKVTEVEENADTLVFECDMLITKYNQMAIYITNDALGHTSSAYTGVASTANSVSIKYGSATAECGKWVHFKLEYTKTEADGANKGTMTITIDDTSATFTNADSIDLDAADTLVFAVQTATIHDTLYDNIVCKKVCRVAE